MSFILNIGTLIEGEIETLAFGGEGILRYQGFVVFIPFTAVGDHITCCITEVKRSFAKGKLISLKRASSERTEPHCPYFGLCGGCQLQHLKFEAQVKYKSQVVKDAIERIGHLNPPPITVVPTTTNWAYRRHITLRLHPQTGRFVAGYTGRDGQSLIPIQTCPIFNEPQDTILQEIKHLVDQIDNPLQLKGRLTILKNHCKQFVLSFAFEPKFSVDQRFFLNALQQNSQLAGILIQVPTKETVILGNPYSEEKVDGLTFRFTPQAFIQNHPEQSTNIYHQICQLALQTTPSHILDLYCGFGITSLLLAQNGHKVTGIEQTREAIQFAKDNAAFNQLKNVHFLQGDVEKQLPSWIKRHDVPLILVNPPRQGLTKGVIELLLKAKADHLVYVSCMPSTLARDLKLLCEKTYQPKEIFVYDMFPQTAHVETLVYLKKN